MVLTSTKSSIKSLGAIGKSINEVADRITGKPQAIQRRV
jgi:hypothetical protein